MSASQATPAAAVLSTDETAVSSTLPAKTLAGLAPEDDTVMGGTAAVPTEEAVSYLWCTAVYLYVC